MKRIISIFTAVSMLIAMTVIGFPVSARNPHASPNSQPGPYRQRGASGLKLPRSAVIGSTAERMAAFHGLTPEQRKKKIEQFIADVSPFVQKELARRNGKEKEMKLNGGKGAWVLPGLLGKKVRLDSRARRWNNGPLGFANANMAMMPIEPDPDPTNQPPTVVMTASRTSGPAPLTVQFAAYASDPDGIVVDYFWDFGDGQYSYAMNPLHTFYSAGVYLVSITVTDDMGATGAYAAYITVTGNSNQPPQVSVSASPLSGQAPLTVGFNANASDPDGYIASYTWSFGDGQYAYEASPVHTYQSTGAYMATATVTDNAGAIASASVTINVTSGPPTNQPPQVSIAASPTSGQVPLTVNFTPAAYDPDGYIASYSWSFGDGQYSSAFNPAHTYQAAGNFTATVTVWDNAGATATASVGISVTSGPPPGGADADFDGLPDTLEEQVANSFTPYYFVSAGERYGTGFTRFYNFVPQTPIPGTQVVVPPISHFRVVPMGFARDAATGIEYGFVRIDYLTLWNRDDGLDVGGDCTFSLTVLGGLVGFSGSLLLQGFQAHDIDDERSAVLIAAPTSGPHAYNSDAMAYSAYSFYTAAHEGTPTDNSMYFDPSSPVAAGNHIVLGFSRSKHATYFFNPDHWPLMPDWLIYTTYSTIEFLYWAGYIDYWSYLFYLYLADSCFFSCFVEHFSDQGGSYAGTRINVGEPGVPLNSSGFIEDQRVREKLTSILWSIN